MLIKKLFKLAFILILLASIPSCGGGGGGSSSPGGSNQDNGSGSSSLPLTISLPGSITAKAGETITVPVSLNNLEGIYGADLTITFDADALTAKYIELTHASEAFLSQNKISGASIRIVLAGKNSLIQQSSQSDTSIINIIFGISSSASGKQCALTLVNPVLYNTDAGTIDNVRINNGILTIQ